MRRAPDPDVETCAHGYAIEAARSECARCADRPVVIRAVDTRFPQTRWHGTDTTLGPRVKVVVTFALVVPLLVMLFEMYYAVHRPILTLLIVPVSGLLVFDVQFLPYLWEAGRRPVREGSGADDPSA